jgi:hypothetical protein
MNKVIVFCLVTLLLSVVPVCADNFRCPNGNIVSTGDSIAIVAIKCDPPFYTTKRQEPVQATVDGRHGSRIVYIEVEEWVYNQGSTLLHTLFFRNGILTEVRTGGFAK